MSDTCQHGYLPGYCGACDAAAKDAEIAALRADCVTWAQRAKDAEEALSRVTIERSREGSALRAEVERLNLAFESANLHAIEAEVALARVTEERANAVAAQNRLAASVAEWEDDWSEEAQKRRDAEAECARLRAEGDEWKARRDGAMATIEGMRLDVEGAEARGFAAGVEAACAFTMQDADDRNRSAPPSAHRVAGRLAEEFCTRLRAATRRSPSPATGPAPLRCAVCKCGWEEGTFDPDCECRCHTDPTYKPTERTPHPAPRSSAEDAAPRCEAVSYFGRTCEMPVGHEGPHTHRNGSVISQWREDHHGTGRSPSTGGGK